MTRHTATLVGTVCAKRADQLHVSGAADAGHCHPERFGDLNGERSNSIGSTVGQDLLSRLHARLLQTREGA